MKMTWKQLEQKSIPRRRERGRGGAGREAIMIVKGRGDGTIGGGSRGERRRKTSEWRKKGDAVGWSWRTSHDQSCTIGDSENFICIASFKTSGRCC